MREVATTPGGQRRTRWSYLVSAIAIVLALTVLALTLSACGSTSGPASFVGPGERDIERPPTPPATSVAGTWSGGNNSMRLIWRLTQEGQSVSGTSQVTSSNGWTGGEGHLVGRVTGTTLKFTDIHPAGSLTAAGCSAEFEGTLELHSIPAPVATPRPSYPPGYPINPPTPPARMSLSGILQGNACDGPVNGMVTLFRN